MEEIWVDIKGFDGKYKLSSLGKVMSMNFNNTGKPKLLKVRKNHYGYNEVTLSKNNKRKFYLLITLLAEHFLEKPAPDMIPIHIGDTDNDTVENIAYAYRSEMLHLMYKKGHRKVGTPTSNIISYKGKSYRKFSHLAKDYNLTGKQLQHRIEEGWTLQEALEIPFNRKERMLHKKLYNYNGKLLSVRQLSKIYGISEKNIYRRLSRGWSIEETIEIPLLKKGDK